MNAASRRPTPRPVFDRPTLIPATDRARHIWGDSASGFVLDVLPPGTPHSYLSAGDSEAVWLCGIGPGWTNLTDIGPEHE